MTHISTIPHPQAVRCILFDVGNTLWEVSTNDESELLIPIEERLMATLERHIPPRRWEQVDRKYVKQHFRQAMFKKMRQYFITNTEHEPPVAHIVNATLQDFFLPPLELTISQQIFEEMRVPLIHVRRLLPDAIATLQELKARGYQLGIVTNRYHGGQIFKQELQYFGLLEFFDPDTLAVSADLGIRKPHREIFYYALDRLGMRPEESAMVGDNIVADVIAPHQIHMQTVWMPHPRLLAEYRALRENQPADDTEELIQYALDHREEERAHYPFTRPDYTINQLSDLLTIFTGVHTS
jgi:putative hydrolase of the HAD superfamily